jgi:Xaa-Pro aminopeptidase
VGDYRVPDGAALDGRTRPWRPLAPGMVLTVEPGLYLRPADNVPQALQHIGIRIEDDVLVTADGHRVLSADAPTAVADVEALSRR